MIWPLCLDAHRKLRFQGDTAAANLPWIFPAALYFAAGKLCFQSCEICMYTRSVCSVLSGGWGSVDKPHAPLYNDAILKGCAKWHYLENFALNAAPDIWIRWSIVRSGFYSSAYYRRRRPTAASVCRCRKRRSRAADDVSSAASFVFPHTGMRKRRGCIHSPSFSNPIGCLAKNSRRFSFLGLVWK